MSRQQASPETASDAGSLVTIGWREWCSLPDLGISRIKAKIDTGARTSALHAINIQYVTRHGGVWVKFDVHPLQRDARELVHAEAPLLEERYVTNSGGKRTLRPVILTPVDLYGRRLLAEITLVSRDDMGFRMLIGRQALRGKFLVNPGKSFLAGTPGRPATKKKKVRKAKAKP